MDKSLLIIEMPTLNDEAVVGIYHFLQELMSAFESHYFYQLHRYYQQRPFDDGIDNLF